MYDYPREALICNASNSELLDRHRGHWDVGIIR